LYPTVKIKNKFWRHFAIRSVQALNYALFLPICRLIGFLYNPKKECHCQLGTSFYESKFYKEHIFPLSTMEFEGKEYPVPGNTDAYLTSLFGDWRKLPSDEEIRKSLHSPVYIKEIFGE
jgi:lipopolysaccharide cholinephosphotransferase